jgi:DNA-binding CsgD family transcriptional regulator
MSLIKKGASCFDAPFLLLLYNLRATFLSLNWVIMRQDHLALTSCQNIKQICQPLERLGMTSFNYFRIFLDGSRINLMTQGAWLEHFYNNKLYLDGLFESSPKNYQSGYFLWLGLLNQKVFYEASKYFNIDNGITIIDRQQDYCDFYCIGSTRDNNQAANFYINNIEFLQKFTSHFKQAAKDIISAAEKDKIILPEFELMAQKTPAYPYFDNKKADFTFGVSALESQDGKLSQRELACIQLLAKGYTFKEIAKFMNLSPKTIETYITRAKNKFNCRNKTELVAHYLKQQG